MKIPKEKFKMSFTSPSAKENHNLNNDDAEYAAIYTSVFNKLNNIWALKDSRLSAEIFKRITGKSVIGPHRIRWLKFFEAVSLD